MSTNCNKWSLDAPVYSENMLLPLKEYSRSWNFKITKMKQTQISFLKFPFYYRKIILKCFCSLCHGGTSLTGLMIPPRGLPHNKLLRVKGSAPLSTNKEMVNTLREAGLPVKASGKEGELLAAREFYPAQSASSCAPAMQPESTPPLSF